MTVFLIVCLAFALTGGVVASCICYANGFKNGTISGRYEGEERGLRESQATAVAAGVGEFRIQFPKTGETEFYFLTPKEIISRAEAARQQKKPEEKATP